MHRWRSPLRYVSKSTRTLLQGGLAATMLAIAGSALSTATYEVLISGLDSLQTGRVILIFSSLLFFLWALAILRRMAGQALHASARMYRVEGARAHGAIVMGLSALTPGELSEVANDIVEFQGQWKLIAKTTQEFKQEMEDRRNSGLPVPFGGRRDANRRVGLNRWQQNVRAIAPHRGTLQQVVILPSEESLPQFDVFKRYVESLFSVNGDAPFDVDYVRQDEQSDEHFGMRPLGGGSGRDYEHFEYVYEGLLRALAQLGIAEEDVANGKAYRPTEVCVDATAGIKVFSIAAAIVTLNTKVVFSYVTNRGETMVYDAAVSFPSFGA